MIPNSPSPSWGIGMILELSKMSNIHNIESQVLSTGKVSINWFKDSPEISELDHCTEGIALTDILIVPEVLASNKKIGQVSCRKFVLIQAGFFINMGLKGSANFQQLGFEGAIAVMPHIQKIIDKFLPIDSYIIPPFVPDFFSEKSKVEVAKREHRLVIFPKPLYRSNFDFEILQSLLRSRTGAVVKNNWEVIKLSGFNHNEVAKLLSTSAVFINCNCFEALNTTVVEAMACGCINFCYEAYGGQDFLIDRHNAFVFNNNYVFDLVASVFDYIDNWDSRVKDLQQVQEGGYKTASPYSRSSTEVALLQFYNQVL